MKYKDKCVWIGDELVPVGYSVGSVFSMMQHGIIASATQMNEIEPSNLNRLECYFMITAGLWHYDPTLTVNKIATLLKEVPLKKMQNAIKAALDILKESPRKTELSKPSNYK